MKKYNGLTKIIESMKKNMFLLAGVLAVSLIGSSCSNAQKKASAESEEQALFACADSTTMERGE